MLYFYQLGDKIIGWLKNIANAFLLPMSSPEFADLLTGKTGNDVLDALFQPLSLPLRALLLQAGDLTFLEFFMSTGVFIFVFITLLKWILPTS